MLSRRGGAAINPFQTVERKDVGITLRIKPQIGENGTIRMTIYQENSSVNTAQSTTSGLVTDKSSIETTVTVDDGTVASNHVSQAATTTIR